jgi:hypothetical protein
MENKKYVTTSFDDLQKLAKEMQSISGGFRHLIEKLDDQIKALTRIKADINDWVDLDVAVFDEIIQKIKTMRTHIKIAQELYDSKTLGRNLEDIVNNVQEYLTEEIDVELQKAASECTSLETIAHWTRPSPERTIYGIMTKLKIIRENYGIQHQSSLVARKRPLFTVYNINNYK